MWQWSVCKTVGWTLVWHNGLSGVLWCDLQCDVHLIRRAEIHMHHQKCIQLTRKGLGGWFCAHSIASVMCKLSSKTDTNELNVSSCVLGSRVETVPKLFLWTENRFRCLGSPDFKAYSQVSVIKMPCWQSVDIDERGRIKGLGIEPHIVFNRFSLKLTVIPYGEYYVIRLGENQCQLLPYLVYK